MVGDLALTGRTERGFLHRGDNAGWVRFQRHRTGGLYQAAGPGHGRNRAVARGGAVDCASADDGSGYHSGPVPYPWDWVKAEDDSSSGDSGYRGLLVSTIITLVLVPVVYTIFDDWGIRFRGVWPEEIKTADLEV